MALSPPTTESSRVVSRRVAFEPITFVLPEPTPTRRFATTARSGTLLAAFGGFVAPGRWVERSPGVWRVAASGAQGRRVRVVHGDRGDASRVLAVLVVEAGGVSLRMNDLVAGYLEHLRAAGYAASTMRRYEQLWRIWLAPDLGRRYVRETSRETMAAVLNAMEDGGQSEASIRQASGLLTAAMGWAREHEPAKPTDTTRNARRGPYRHGIDPNQAGQQA